MIFSSIEFIYFFMPPVLIGFLVLVWLRREQAVIAWLLAASFVFYAWWSIPHLALLLCSIGGNYACHLAIQRWRHRSILIAGIVANLGLLAWFKYADFLIDNFNAALGKDIAELNLILPLAISFFTFQQISFLHDSWSGRARQAGFLRYALFVAFFPQLIAGPIVMQKDTIGQFRMPVFANRLGLNLAVGSTLFVIGLCKKIIIADSMASIANAVFLMAEQDQAISMQLAWTGALAYTFQIYFDFSGYCDMAIGLARMFGIRLPINFNSPYKAVSISDFWRRWHITLSRFLRDYVYIPLGGNRHGPIRQHGNLMATMLLGGLWHGAGWNFVIWGGLHGAFLVVNHLWRRTLLAGWMEQHVAIWLRYTLSWTLTMSAVVIAWVFFRATTFDSAVNILAAMAGQGAGNLAAWPVQIADATLVFAQFGLLAAIVLLLPNSLELTRHYRPVLNVSAELRSNAYRTFWRPSSRWGIAMGFAGLAAVVQIYRLNDLTEFIYFNF